MTVQHPNGQIEASPRYDRFGNPQETFTIWLSWHTPSKYHRLVAGEFLERSYPRIEPVRRGIPEEYRFTQQVQIKESGVELTMVLRLVTDRKAEIIEPQ